MAPRLLTHLLGPLLKFGYNPVSMKKANGIILVTGLFLSNESTIGPAIDLLALVLREASRDR